MEDYRKVNETYYLILVQPYALCGRTGVKSFAEWAGRNKIPLDQIRYVFEDGAKHKGLLQKRIFKDKGFEPVFRKKADAVPLQAADLLAYETLAAIRDVFEDGITDFDDLRYPMRMLLRVPHEEIDWGTYTEQSLIDFCDRIPIPRRDRLPAREFEGMMPKEIEIKLLEIWNAAASALQT